MLTDRAAILALDDLETITVRVDKWGEVRLREMTAGLRELWETRWLSQETEGASRYDGLRAHLVALSVVDEKGARVFADSDIDELQKKSARAISALFDAAMTLNRLSDADVAVTEKNSERGPSASTSSP